MRVDWEYWPKLVDGSQDDPKTGHNFVDDLLDANRLVDHLKIQCGDSLRFVTVTSTIYEKSR